MDADELRQHLDQMASKAGLVNLPDLLRERAVSCVDGRKPDCIVGAPGGNAGLFVLMLSSYESATGKVLPPSRVEDLFGAYLDEFGHFYMHTDDLALGRMRAALADRWDGERFAEDPIEMLVRRPPEDARPRLLDLLLDPDHVGCGHLMLMLKHPDEYDVRPELIRSIFRVYFDRLWERDSRLVFDVLEGVHDEKAVVKIHVERSPTDGSAIALAAPSYRDTDVFVYHPEAAAYFERENAAFLSRMGLIETSETDRFAAEQKAVGLKQLAATLRHLAPTLPVFDATFRVQGSRVECLDVRRAA